MRRPQFTMDRSADGRPAMQIHSRGLQVLDDPQTNEVLFYRLVGDHVEEPAASW
jgi:hypothetical protein